MTTGTGDNGEQGCGAEPSRQRLSPAGTGGLHGDVCPMWTVWT